MSCDRYLELLSARLDGELTDDGERELEEHLSVCPDCRAAGAQLAALRDAFSELEEEAAPEGFAQGVMERARAEKKVVPLFRRPRFRALAGLAACAVLAVGLYGAAQQRQTRNDAEEWNVMVRSFNKDAVTEFEDASDAPMYGTCTADQEAPASEQREYSAGREAQKAVPQGDAVLYAVDADATAAAPVAGARVLTVERMPEGGWELIPPETPVSPEGMYVTGELLKQIERLAAEQGITASLTSGPEEAEEFVIIVLDGTQ